MILKVNYGNYEEELDLKEEIGKGAFGSVYLASDRRGVPFAVKISNCINAATFFTAYQEIQILLNVVHQNVARMYAFDFLNNKAVLVIEYCNGGNLNDRLNKFVFDKLKVQWMSELLLAMQYLHSKNIVHRDLKPENVLLRNEVIKLTDFGISRYYMQRAANEEENNNLSEYIESFMGTFAGTPYWIAPEVFEHQYTEKADLFSLGILLYAILTRQSITYDNKSYYGAFVPYNGKQVGIGLVMYEQNKPDLRPDFQSVDLHFSHNRKIRDVILQLLEFNPHKRLSISKALAIILNLKVDVNRKRKLDNDDCRTSSKRYNSTLNVPPSTNNSNWFQPINNQQQQKHSFPTGSSKYEDSTLLILQDRETAEEDKKSQSALDWFNSGFQTVIRSAVENFGGNKTSGPEKVDDTDLEKSIPSAPSSSSATEVQPSNTDTFAMFIAFIGVLILATCWFYRFVIEIFRNKF